MSAETARVYRLTLGMTVSAGIAFYLAWPFSFITPVLAAKLLSLPKVMPPKAAIAFVGLLGGSFIVSAKLLLPTLSYPVVHLMVVGLIFFHLFYAKAGGANPLLVVFALIGVMAIPLIGTASIALKVGRRRRPRQRNRLKSHPHPKNRLPRRHCPPLLQ